MTFLDANCYVGLPTNGALRPVRTAPELLAAMDRAGIARALVWHVAQRDADPIEGNRLLAEAIAPHRDRLWGCWTLLPPQCAELPSLQLFFDGMRAAQVKALRVFPVAHRWLLRSETIGEWLDAFSALHVPLFLSPSAVGGWEPIYNLLAEFPDLHIVISDVGLWGPDRYVRPLFERYTGVCMELSQYILAGGIAELVRTYGAGRLLYGSGFPEWEHGGMMLALKHAEISDDDRAAIAADNLGRLLAW